MERANGVLLNIKNKNKTDGPKDRANFGKNIDGLHKSGTTLEGAEGVQKREQKEKQTIYY